MPGPELGRVLRLASTSDPTSVPDVLLSVAEGLGGADLVVYLVDFAQVTLEPLPDRSTHAELPTSESVVATMAGRAFLEQRTVTASRPDGVRVWVPVIEGTDRTGVLAVTVPEVSGATIRACEEMGLLAGYLIAAQSRITDIYSLHRRKRSLSLAASMQWDLLPPLVVKTARVAVAGLLEPAYEVGGDCFDYAVNETVLDLAVIDALGHGVASALMATLAVGCFRHDRRENLSLPKIHSNMDAVMSAQFPDGLATGQLARVDLQTGTMTWANAGHPLPMLIRGGKVIRELLCPPALPWGLGALAGAPVLTVAAETLEPGDDVLFYTDGIVDAYDTDGGRFGEERLVDLVGQTASDGLEPEEVVRRLLRSVIDHQSDLLRDDATLVLVHWNGPAATEQ